MFVGATVGAGVAAAHAVNRETSRNNKQIFLKCIFTSTSVVFLPCAAGLDKVFRQMWILTKMQVNIRGLQVAVSVSIGAGLFAICARADEIGSLL